MHDPDLIELFIRPLEDAGVEYMISGSVATSIFGEPRSTLDIDLAVFPDAANLARFSVFYPEQEFYLPPLEVMQLECRRESRGHFNIIHHSSGFKADIYPSRSYPYLSWALAHKRRIEVTSFPVWVASPEYVILMKLEFFREGGSQKHLRDIAGVIAQQDLDIVFLESAAARLRLESEWQAARLLAAN